MMTGDIIIDGVRVTPTGYSGMRRSERCRRCAMTFVIGAPAYDAGNVVCPECKRAFWSVKAKAPDCGYIIVCGIRP